MIATIPYTSGIETSVMGMHARSAIISVTINSNGCISPIWRFPIKRISTIRVIMIIIVLIKVTNILLVCIKQGFLYFLLDFG